MARKTQQEKPNQKDIGLYEFEVRLVSGLVSESFAMENPKVVRTIQIKGNQTLDKLHYAIFDSVSFFDDHLYEFQLGAKKPYSRSAKRYTLPMAMDKLSGERNPVGNVTKTRVKSLGLKKNQTFIYVFDFGDEWIFQIKLLNILDEIPTGRFPKVTGRVGEDPPQYVNLEEEEDWDGDEVGFKVIR